MSLVILSGAPGAGKKTLQEVALDQIRGLKPITTFELKWFEDSAIGEISSQADKTSVILNAALVEKTSTGFVPIYPRIIEELKPKSIIIIEADPKEIQQRQFEQERMTLNEIALLQDYSRSVACAYSVAKGIPVRVIFNQHKKIRDAALELTEVLKHVF